jgi:ABC-type cobalamin/Fe3+-siderophores transport system ATPase subunit
MRNALDMDATLEDFISPGSEWIEIGNKRQHVKSYLGDFLFSPARANSPVRSLSGGERNRLLLARLFARPANVLVLDEPTSALDLHRQPAILNVIDRQRREHGTTVLCTMHNITLAAMYARDFVVMNHGQVVDQGTAAQVFAGEHLARAFNDNIEIFAGPDGTPIVLPRR